MAIKGAIFDMDGTLTESMHLWIEIGRRYLEGLSYTVTPEQTYDMTQMLLEPMSEYILEHFDLDRTPEEIVADMNRMVEPGYFEEVEVKPEVFDFLRDLQERGVKMVVATATDRYLTEACLKRTGLDVFFDAIFTCGEEHCTKRTSHIYDKARVYLGTDPEETYIFEDTYVSILGALQSGCHVIAVADRWAEKKRPLIAETAEAFYESMGEIDLEAF